MKILIISGEYPPMKGGVGRYTSNLVKSLIKKSDTKVYLALGKNIVLSELNDQQQNFTNSKQDTYDNNNNNNNKESNNLENNNIQQVYYNVIKKGDKKNSDRLLNLVDKIKPDIINIQYERGLYENDANIKHIMERSLYGSTLHKFFKETQTPTIATLHTVMPPDEYKEYIQERAGRKEGRFAILPRPVRFQIRKWALERRYKLLFEIVSLSTNIISPAQTIKDIINIGTVIYHGAEPFPSTSSKYSQQYRNELGLPTDKKLLLAFGYVGSYKGFDVLDNITLPVDWKLVVKQNKHERGKEKPIQIKNAINLHLGYLDDLTLSKLFFACDAIIFPYRLVSVSGVMFDALAHGLPFIASDLRFFKEFAEMGLGITCSRDPRDFSDAIRKLAYDHQSYTNKISQFNSSLKWDNVAQQHLDFFQRQNTKILV